MHPQKTDSTSVPASRIDAPKLMEAAVATA